MDILDQLDQCDGLDDSDRLKIEIVEKIRDPLDLVKVLVEWQEMLGDRYYSEFYGAILVAAEKIAGGKRDWQRNWQSDKRDER